MTKPIPKSLKRMIDSAPCNVWRPIESAPRDGTEILVFGRRIDCEIYGIQDQIVQAVCRYSENTAYAIYESDTESEDFCWLVVASSYRRCHVEATHWQHKPEDPA